MLDEGVGINEYAMLPLGTFLSADIKEPAPLVEGLIPSGTITMLAGQHKVGKTMLMSQLALSVASGVSWVGHHTHRTKVLYLNYEVAPWSFKRRLQKQVEGLSKLTGTDIRKAASGNMLVQSLPELRLNKHSDLTELGTYAANHGVGLIVVDPIRGAFQGDRNKDETVDRVMQELLDRIVKRSGAAIILGHHMRKPPSGEDTTGSTWEMKGSGGFADAADQIITLRRSKDDHRIVVASFTLRHYEEPDELELLFKHTGLVFTTTQPEESPQLSVYSTHGGS